MRVTSVIISLEYRRPNVSTILYQKPRDDSNATIITLYEAWNKPEEAEKWRAKLQQIEEFEK
jgi:hypothetical protein